MPLQTPLTNDFFTLIHLFIFLFTTSRMVYCNYLGGMRGKGFMMLRNVPKLIFFGHDWVGKDCRFSDILNYLTKRAELVQDISRSL